MALAVEMFANSQSIASIGSLISHYLHAVSPLLYHAKCEIELHPGLHAVSPLL